MIKNMFNTSTFNPHLMSFDSQLTAQLQQATSSLLALGEQDALTSLNIMLRHDMALWYSRWLREMGVPLKESDRFTHDKLFQAGLYLQNGVCIAQIDKTFHYVTQSSSFVIACTNTQTPRKQDEVRQELLPSVSDIRANQLTVAVLGKCSNGLCVEEMVKLSGQSLYSLVPFVYYMKYAKSLVNLLFKQTLAVTYRYDGKPVKAEVNLSPLQVRQHFAVSTIDEARLVVLRGLTDPDTLGWLPVFDMVKGNQLRQIPVLSLSKLVPISAL